MTPTFASNAVADIPLSVDEQGVIRIGNSGVLLESVMLLHREGATPNEILDAFTSLDAADLHYVLGFAIKHETEIDRYLQSRAEDEARIRGEVENQFDVSELKSRVQQHRSSSE